MPVRIDGRSIIEFRCAGRIGLRLYPLSVLSVSKGLTQPPDGHRIAPVMQLWLALSVAND